ncbi:hypothetical protein WA556_004731, partial [Blastocystis sp. ATCC 50177/Nand II]
LVCHSCVCSCVCSSVCSCVCHSSVCSCVCHSSVCSSQVCLSLVRHSSLSRVCLFVRRWSVSSSICSGRGRCPVVCHSSFTDPSLVMAARASARSSRVALPVAFLSAVLSPVCLLFCHQSVCCSVTSLSAVLSPVCLLFCHQSVCSGHGRWFVVRPSAARRWSVYWSRGNWPVPGLSARSSLVRLIGSWSLACSSVAGLLFVRHWPWSSICYSCTACLSPRLSCRSFACCSAIGPPLLCLLSVVGSSLVHLLVHRWSICYSAGSLSARSSLVHPFGSCHSCVCSTRRWCVIGVSLVCRWCVTDLSLTCH